MFRTQSDLLDGVSVLETRIEIFVHSHREVNDYFFRMRAILFAPCTQLSQRSLSKSVNFIIWCHYHCVVISTCNLCDPFVLKKLNFLRLRNIFHVSMPQLTLIFWTSTSTPWVYFPLAVQSHTVEISTSNVYNSLTFQLCDFDNSLIFVPSLVPKSASPWVNETIFR